MNRQEFYIEQVRRHLVAATVERERFENDLRSHFEQAGGSSEPVGETIRKLGTAESIAAAFNQERNLVYAGFFRRLGAFLVDFALMLAVLLPIGLTVALIHDRTGSVEVFTIIAVVFGALLILAFSLLYFPLLEARFGKTLGKHLMGIRVLDEQYGPITMGQAIIRRFSLWLEILAIDALFIPFTERKQRAFDIVARTIVVKEPAKSLSPAAEVL